MTLQADTVTNGDTFKSNNITSIMLYMLPQCAGASGFSLSADRALSILRYSPLEAEGKIIRS